MTYETLQIQTDDAGIATVTLNRPAKRNALSGQMIADLTDLAATVGLDRTVRAMILSGAGDVFCAGGDLDWMKAQIDADRATRMAEARKLAMMLNALNEMPVPVIARIHGGAFGGGVGMACVADIAIAEDGARFGLTETRLGLIPATIGPYVIARLGEGKARRVFMSSRRFGAAEAQELGVVAKVVPMADLDHAVAQEARAYLAVSPDAVASAKALARTLGPRIDADVIDQTIARLADTWETDAAREGIAAFLEKRAPDWDRS